MKDFLIGFKMVLALSVLTGILYPGLISGYSLFFVNQKAHGGLLMSNGQTIGSELLGQKFTKPEYFWSRPSSIDYNPSSSGASNLGAISETLKKQVSERTQTLMTTHPDAQSQIPQDLLFASGSGLDPHITPEAAHFQIKRVAKARNLDLDKVNGLVAQMTEKPQFGILGQSRVNVLKLNLALDQMK